MSKNLKKYQEYVKGLRERGEPFPVNDNGNPNWSAMAHQCGFDRNVFYANTGVIKAFNEDVVEIGTEIKEGKTPENRLSRKANEKSKEAATLRKELDAKVQEAAQLREQVESLEKRVRELENRKSEQEQAMNELCGSGRRFFI